MGRLAKFGEVLYSPLRFIFGTVPDYLFSRRVQNWHTSMRGWKGDEVRVIVTCESRLWHWALADWLWGWQQWLCHWLGVVPLPKFITNLQGIYDADDKEHPCTFGEWFGDDVGGLWHIFICEPVFQAIWKHFVGERVVDFELTLEEARQKFSHDPSQYEWVEKEVAQHERWDAEEEQEEVSV